MNGKDLEGKRFRLVKYLSYGTGENFQPDITTGKIDTFVSNGMLGTKDYYKVYFDGQQHTTYYYIRRKDFVLMDEPVLVFDDEEFLL